MLNALSQVRKALTMSRLEKFLSRGNRWFFLLGGLYLRDTKGTALLETALGVQSYPGRRGSLFIRFPSRRVPPVREPDALLISGLGRFGNGVQQLVHAGNLMQTLRTPRLLYFPNSHMAATRYTLEDGSSVEPVSRNLFAATSRPRRLWRSNFFESGSENHRFDEGASARMRPVLRKIYDHLISDTPGPPDTLTIHLRGGDIFGDNPHSSYGQPPLSFYEKVLDSRVWTRVVLVAEDSLNPCLEGIISYCTHRGIPTQITGQRLEDATITISKATNLVASRGTFVPAITYLSNVPRNVYQFHTAIDIIPSTVANHYLTIRDRDGHYQRAIMGREWRNTAEQRQLMMEYPRNSLTDL